MPESEKSTHVQLKDGQDRTLRSASPAIKRPASDMGAQEREEHASDVEMEGTTSHDQPHAHTPTDKSRDAKAKQEHGKRPRCEEGEDHNLPHASDPKSVSQLAPSEDSSSNTADSLLPSPSKTSTAATSTDEQHMPADSLPSIDEQVTKVMQIMREEVKDRQKGYVVSGRWLRRVQARSQLAPEAKSIEKSATDGPIGPIDNSDIAMIIEDSGELMDEAGEKFVEMRPNLTMGEDYEVLPQEAWDLIVSWYGVARTSPIITRYAHDTSDGDLPNVLYELNPPVWSLLKVPATHTPQTQRDKDATPARMSQSRYTPFQTWLKQAKELVHIDLATHVRVWRILGGLKSTNASGILTPAASRSASPAPGAELVASAGDRMLLDVNTFALLQLGEHRELLDVKDHTHDPHYNGHVTLATLGLGRNDVIVLEEQHGKSEEWPSDNVKLSLGKNLQTKAKSLTASGRTSPAPSIMTRGRPRRDGRPKGMTGLSNLGNTCYMNSALQCIRSVAELTQYFLNDKWKEELNPNNPLGHHGNVAKAYADLIHQIYNESSSSCNPSRFKATVGKYGTSFSGYGQQDSQEFLLFLLDGLQEDLNRILKKPYIEKPDSTDEMVHDQQALKDFADKNWEIYKARNDSVITDLFAGMYKSTVTCPVCDKVSIIFDPFNNLTLQLPVENNWQKEVLYFPCRKPPFKVDVEIDKNASITGVKEFVAKRTGSDPARLIMAESYKNRFFKMFNNNDTLSEVNIGQHDTICIYEMDETPTNYNPNKKKKASSYGTMFSREADDELVELDSSEADRLLVPVYNRVVKQTASRTTRTFFAHPTYVVINRNDSASLDGVVKKLLQVVATMTTRKILEEDNIAPEQDTAPEDSDTLVMTDDGSSSVSNVKATSVQGEDGLVDVSMRDASQASIDDGMDTDSPLHPVLQAGTPVPAQLRDLFDIRIAATGEGIPTGWNSIDEHKEYASIIERLPKDVTHRSTDAKATEDDDSSSISMDDLADIQHSEHKVGAVSGSESSDSAVHASDNESEDDLPAIEHVIKDDRALKNRNNKKKKTYGRRDRGKGAVSKQTSVLPQPQPRLQQRTHNRTQHIQTPNDGSIALIRPGEAIILDWDNDTWESLFGAEKGTDEFRGSPTWINMDVLADEELGAKRDKLQKRKKNGISLEDCLNEFGKEETLSEQNAWYCPRCKEHRRARKMFELWKAPDILVMHLKRFSSNRSFRDKLEVRVEYPVEELDLSGMVRDQSDGKSLLYDLIAVDNHYGGLGGGHYTAYAKNFINGGWYDYNDSHVSSKPDAQSVVTSAAYLLFYRRRSEDTLGGPYFEKVLAEAEPDSVKSREPSPSSGEGRRLGDSSHNGLSSAYPAVQVHRVGDGGPARKTAAVSGRMNRDLTPEDDENPLGRVAKRVSSDSLPSYDQTMAHDREMLLGPEDEGVVDLTGTNPMWHQPAAWNWEGVAGHANSDADQFEDNSSTRGEGASPPASLPDDDDNDDDDHFMHSEDIHDDFARRGMRESAPAPDIRAVNIGSTHVNDEDDDDLPVQELRVDQDGGEMRFHPAGPE